MFDTRKFGGYLSRLRKNADMTQSDLANQLNLTRQAVSRYELGDSFPDISILVRIADIFGVTLDELVNSGEPTHNESLILRRAALGEAEAAGGNVEEIINLAPLLKPSVVGKLAAGLSRQGIDISSIVTLAEYLNDESVLALLENASFERVDDLLLEKIVPLLDEKSKAVIIYKIFDGEMDWHMLRVVLPYARYVESQVEEAVLEGALPWEALKLMRETLHESEGGS